MHSLGHHQLDALCGAGLQPHSSATGHLWSSAQPAHPHMAALSANPTCKIEMKENMQHLHRAGLITSPPKEDLDPTR